MTAKPSTGNSLLDELYLRLETLSVEMAQVKDMIALKQDGRPPDPQVIFPYYGIRPVGDAALAYLRDVKKVQTFAEIRDGIKAGGYKMRPRQQENQVNMALTYLSKKENPEVWVDKETRTAGLTEYGMSIAIKPPTVTP